MQIGPALVGINCANIENFRKITEKMAELNLWFKLLKTDDEIFKLML
jgi:hypothetical protein